MRRIVQLDILLFAVGFVVGAAVASPAAGCAAVGALASLLERAVWGRRWATVTLAFCTATVTTLLCAPVLNDLPLQAGPQEFLLEGTLLDGPRAYPRSSSYELRVRLADGAAVDATVKLYVSEPDSARAGDHVRVFARCSLFAPPEFPGDAGAAARWAAHGLAAGCSSREPIERLRGPRNLRDLLRSTLTRRRLAIEDRLRALLGRRAGVPIAMLTGTRGLIHDSERRAHQRAGTAHLLAISGVHFGALAAIVWGLAGFALRRSRRVTRTFGARRASAGVVLATMLAYLLFVGAPISAVRASIAMGSIVLALLIGRRASGIAAVSAAAIGLLAVHPGLVRDLGFQLSFTATIAIVLFWARLPTSLAHDPYAFEPTSATRSAARALGRFVMMSWAATAVTAPILVGTLGELSVVAFVTNLVAVPLVSLLLFPALLGGTALLGSIPQLGEPIVWWATEGMLRLTIALEDLATLPGAVLTPGIAPSWWTVAVVGVVLGVLCDRARLRSFAPALIVVGVLTWYVYRPGPPGWRVHFVPVGQGDATLVETPEGRRILVDAGGSTFGRDPGRWIVAPYLRRLGITRLDAVVVTHADTDHAGGVPAVLEQLDVLRLHTEPCPTGIDGVSLARWLPTGSRNNRSIVMTIDAAGFVVVLTGDVEREAEQRWLLGQPHRAHLVKVAHHGSKTSSTAEWLDAARPRLAVVSAGRHNRFGHPHPSVERRLAKRAVATFSTADHGLVTVEVDPGGGVTARVRRP